MENNVVHETVKLYESKRILWDSKHPEYYNKNKREDMWREIALLVNVPVNELKKKMASMLGSYRREKSREKKSRVTGSGQGNVYKSKWFAFTWFEFLSDKDVPNDTVDTMDKADTQKGSEETREASTTEEPIIAEPPPTTLHQEELPASRSTTSVPTFTLVQGRKKKRRNDAANDSVKNEMLLEAFSILKKTSETPSDHCETFGFHVASELRKYDSQTLPHVKRAILDVLFRADIGEFTPTHNVRTDGHYNPTFGTSSSSQGSCT